MVLERRQALVTVRLERLKGSFQPAVVSQLRPWAGQYDNDALRFDFLVLRGASKSGKSTLAKSIGHICGFGKPFVQTVQDAPSPDLRKYDESYGYIVFDNVNHQDFVLSFRAMFQANNDAHTLGASATGIYSYTVWLYRVPIVITIDHNTVWNVQDPWLSENSRLIDLTGPCYSPPPR